MIEESNGTKCWYSITNIFRKKYVVVDYNWNEENKDWLFENIHPMLWDLKVGKSDEVPNELRIHYIPVIITFRRSRDAVLYKLSFDVAKNVGV